MGFAVIYDACVLFPAPLRDLLIRLAQTDVVQARWTDEILDECTTITLAVITGTRYHGRMIRSFADNETEKLFRRERIRRLPPEIQRTALRKLVQLDAAISLDDLRVPPGNRLEALTGDRVGQHSIRINDQWRVCFAWKTDGAEDVEIVDYH